MKPGGATLPRWSQPIGWEGDFDDNIVDRDTELNDDAQACERVFASNEAYLAGRYVGQRPRRPSSARLIVGVVEPRDPGASRGWWPPCPLERGADAAHWRRRAGRAPPGTASHRVPELAELHGAATPGLGRGVGRDFSRGGAPTRQRQLRVFEHVLEHPRIDRKVLSVHSRGAERETVKMLAETRTTAVLHWYAGPLAPLDDALAAGIYFSVNPAMLVSNSGMRVIAALPQDRVLIETDGPYTKFNGRPAEPRHVPSIVSDLAGAWGRGPDEALSLLEGNAERPNRDRRQGRTCGRALSPASRFSAARADLRLAGFGVFSATSPLGGLRMLPLRGTMLAPECHTMERRSESAPVATRRGRRACVGGRLFGRFRCIVAGK